MTENGNRSGVGRHTDSAENACIANTPSSVPARFVGSRLVCGYKRFDKDLQPFETTNSFRLDPAASFRELLASGGTSYTGS